MTINCLESFQIELRDLISTAAAVKSLRLPDMPVFAPVKVAAELVLAAAPLEPLITKAIDAWEKSQSVVGSFVEKGEDDSETFGLRELASASQAQLKSGEF